MDEREGQRARELIDWLATVERAVCRHCGVALCPHELLFASALGRKREPWCSACAAREQGAADATALRTHLLAHFERRHCYSAAWRHAGAIEHGCVLSTLRPAGTLDAFNSPAGAVALPHETFDAGDQGCGDLVLELRLELRAMRPGEVLELLARDPGAPEDIPAWCRMTGHTLLSAAPPRFLIQRKQD